MANLNEIIDLFCKSGLDLKASCFGLWGKSGVSMQTHGEHANTMQRDPWSKPGHELDLIAVGKHCYLLSGQAAHLINGYNLPHVLIYS